MANIEFIFDTQILQKGMEKESEKAVHKEQFANYVAMQPDFNSVKTLDKMSEEALSVILNKYDGNNLLFVKGEYDLFPEDMQYSFNDIFAELKRSGIIASYSLGFDGWSLYLTPAGLGYFENKQKPPEWELPMFRKLQSTSRTLLQELINSDDPAEMLRERFEKCTNQEVDELIGIIRELISEGYIRIPVWADNVPQDVEINDLAKTYSEREAEYLELQAYTTGSVQIKETKGNQAMKKYDLFISHANKEKLPYVNDLYSTLNKLDVEIFINRDTLAWGDTWKQKILEGVDLSEFAIIVISENFFDGDWTEKELNQLLLRQNKNGQKIILPLLNNITFEDLQQKYPSLSELQCLLTTEQSYEGISILFAKELIKRLKQTLIKN
jgi:hypothetical protein